MSKANYSCDGFNFLNKKQLIRFKSKAMRSGAWFKALQSIDRILFDLTIRVVGGIRSAKLAKSILSLIRKLGKYSGSSFSNRLRTMGLPLSKKISLVAQSLGNPSASSWMFDPSFSVFLAILKFNSNGIRKS